MLSLLLSFRYAKYLVYEAAEAYFESSLPSLEIATDRLLNAAKPAKMPSSPTAQTCSSP